MPRSEPSILIDRGYTGYEHLRNYDTQGNLISVTDPAATITYNLRADGQPSNIVAPGNITTLFGYDNYGRITTKVLPEFTTACVYNNDELLASETSNNNTSRTFQYDRYDYTGSIWMGIRFGFLLYFFYLCRVAYCYDFQFYS